MMTHRSPKDVDILLHWFDKRDYREVEILADRLGYDVMDCSDGYGEDTTGAIRCVYKLYKMGELPIDVVFLNYSPKERIAQFPCNASEIWLEGDKLVTTSAFDDFVVTKKLLFTIACPDAYRERMLGYYPQ